MSEDHERRLEKLERVFENGGKRLTKVEDELRQHLNWLVKHRERIEMLERQARPVVIERPALPAAPPGIPPEPTTTCPQCGLIWRSTMAYSCQRMDCPIQPKVIA